MSRGSQQKKTKELWYSLGQRRCYCGVQLNWTNGHKNSASFDHLVLKRNGGTYHRKNALICCHSCNTKRGDTRLDIWMNKHKPPNYKWYLSRYYKALEYYKSTGRKVNE